MQMTGLAPQLKTEDLKRFALGILALAVTIFIVTMPDIAMAAFDGDFAPDKEIAKNSNNSFLYWWRLIASYGLWAGLALLLLSVLFAGARGWWVFVLVVLISLFGETVVIKAGNLAGFDMASGSGSSGTK
ncbi:hypothetical protein OFL75_34400 [Pseudomonas aeruginosa]|uniref:hypothetical protein n=1 Tax=Pseudomonas TaxID=286 RepID=UPI0002CA6E10|nr:MULTISPECIES: hypothetical protein [Pseudomonas]HDS0928958.1 hypothetical protein [Pseudomonas putida]EMZ45894.1 hypothetical protein HMPREF1224_11517 [Pseudomonas sp. P179]MCV6112091.1 hypothetical protein [Pseudomonas aeruginosa]MCV6118955.1 hypothetical protein [Pseudomonas aeruginosa]MCV6125848.1 hypothetical protein [Pseudomonas aeruginosa]